MTAKKPYLAVLVGTVAAHLAFLLYVPSGGFLVLRWPRTLGMHVAAVTWAAGVVVFRLPCPLTWLEARVRDHADLAPLPAGGFIECYAAGVVYPADGTRVAQAMAFSAAAISWVVLTLKRMRRSVGGPARG